MTGVRNPDYAARRCGGLDRVRAKGDRPADGCDVIRGAAIDDIILRIRPCPSVDVIVECRPSVEGHTQADHRGVGELLPAANGLGQAEPEPDLVAVHPAARVRVVSRLAVDAGPELELGEHR